MAWAIVLGINLLVRCVLLKTKLVSDLTFSRGERRKGELLWSPHNDITNVNDGRLDIPELEPVRTNQP